MALNVISLAAGPGAGKSTLAAALFAEMKRRRFSVELVTEYAKECTYDKAWCHLGDQFNVLAQQNYRLTRLEGKVEWVITDSPLFLTLIYCKESERDFFRPIVHGLWNRYHNQAFMLRRTSRPFQQFGRNENLEQAVRIDEKIANLACEFGMRTMLDPDFPNIEREVVEKYLEPACRNAA